MHFVTYVARLLKREIENSNWTKLRCFVKPTKPTSTDLFGIQYNYQELVENMVKNFKAMGCRMFLKVQMPHAHSDKYGNNMGAYREEQEKGFHQDIMDFERVIKANIMKI